LINLAVIGTGARATAYIQPATLKMRPDVRIIALCDTNKSRLEAFRDKWFQDENPPCLYTDYMDVLRDSAVDGVIITTPDTTHRELAVAAFNHGKHVMLEKPIATTVEDAVAIYRAREAHPELAFRVGFTLRHAPFYAQIKKLLEDKAIGDIVTIEAKEALDKRHAASFFRRWHRYKVNNGGFMNAKCSHDLDILTWLVGEKPLYMSSFGSRSYFVPNSKAASNCRNCPLVYECKYAITEEPAYWPEPDRWDACPFNADGDIVDRQVLNIEYSGGAVASFTVTMLSAEPASNRTICIHGTEGSLEGNLHSGLITLHKTYPDITQTYDVTKAGSGGHGGGDPRLFCSFADAIRTGEKLETGDALGGVYASVLAIGSLDAMEQHKVIDVQALIDAY